MAVSGNLRTMPFPDLMQWISASRKTGTLVIKGQRYTKKILFQTGLVSAVTSKQPARAPGVLLVGLGNPHGGGARAPARPAEGAQRHARELLVQTSRSRGKQVDHLVRLKTEETIYDLVNWNEGEFFFLDDVQPRRDFKELQLPVDQFILEGARQLDERRHIRIGHPGLGPHFRAWSRRSTRRASPRQGRRCWRRSTASRASRTSPSRAGCPSPRAELRAPGRQQRRLRAPAARHAPAADPWVPALELARPHPRGGRAASRSATPSRPYRKVLEVREQYPNISKALAARRRSRARDRQGGRQAPDRHHDDPRARARAQGHRPAQVRPRGGVRASPGSTGDTPSPKFSRSWPGESSTTSSSSTI